MIGYTEWGDDNKMFLFQGGIEIIEKIFKDPISVIHPLYYFHFLDKYYWCILYFKKHQVN